MPLWVALLAFVIALTLMAFVLAAGDPQRQASPHHRTNHQAERLRTLCLVLFVVLVALAIGIAVECWQSIL